MCDLIVEIFNSIPGIRGSLGDCIDEYFLSVLCYLLIVLLNFLCWLGYYLLDISMRR